MRIKQALDCSSACSRSAVIGLINTWPMVAWGSSKPSEQTTDPRHADCDLAVMMAWKCMLRGGLRRDSRPASTGSNMIVEAPALWLYHRAIARIVLGPPRLRLSAVLYRKYTHIEHVTVCLGKLLKTSCSWRKKRIRDPESISQVRSGCL